MICKSYEKLRGIRKEHKNKKIVFCSGSFDLTHAGHVLFFEDCKKYGDILVVGVGNDHILRRNKGKGRPILNQYVRLKMIDSLKPVDYCFLDESGAKNHPLDIVEGGLKYLKPDIYIINEDASNISYREQLLLKYGIKMKILKRLCPSEFGDISTSDIVERIKSNT